jgi:hypothetical protein
VGDRKAERGTWQKSSLCNSSDNCVEVRFSEGQIQVRDSKNPERAPLHFSLSEWTQFLCGALLGEFDAMRLVASSVGAASRLPNGEVG